MKRSPYPYREMGPIYTRESKNGSLVRRRRECIKCGKRFTTYDIVERSFVMIKKDIVNRVKILKKPENKSDDMGKIKEVTTKYKKIKDSPNR